MNSKESTWNGGNEGSREGFRRALDNWFRERGIVADLRSHLRHSMVMALQEKMGEAGRASKTDDSPKTRAMDLLVAEFLFGRGCHYTLSVFSSEVPRLEGFASSFQTQKPKKKNQPRMWKIGKERKPSEPTEKERKKFREDEVQDILESLGLSACPTECEGMTKRYLEEDRKYSLLEFILQWAVEIAAKLDIRQNVSSFGDYESDGIELSSAWTCGILDILAKERIKRSQAASIQKSIFRIAESEFKRMREEERKKNMEIVAEREKRIQELLIQYERKIYFKLNEAERELTKKKDAIDEGLTEKQKYLSKMILDWNTKHQEIVRLAKNFYNTRKEKSTLEKENQMLRQRGQSRDEEVFRLRQQIGQLKEENEFFRSQLDLIDTNTIEKEERPTRKFLKSEKEVRGKNTALASDNHSMAAAEECDKEKEEDGVSISQASSDEILSCYREKLQVLEEKSTLINRHYLQYKSKYAMISLSDVEGDYKSSNESSNDVEYNEHMKKSITVYKATKTCQTEKENTPNPEKIKKRNQLITLNDDMSEEENSFQEIWPMSSLKKRTKRQLINREYFLESRKLLQEIRKSKTRLKTPTSGESEHEEEGKDDGEGSPTVKSDSSADLDLTLWWTQTLDSDR